MNWLQTIGALALVISVFSGFISSVRLVLDEFRRRREKQISLRQAMEEVLTKKGPSSLADEVLEAEIKSIEKETGTIIEPTILAQVRQGQEQLLSELRLLREQAKPKPAKMFFGNFFWNAASVIAGYLIGRLLH